jgi:hypothetical protein
VAVLDVAISPLAPRSFALLFADKKGVTLLLLLLLGSQSVSLAAGEFERESE